MLKQINRVANLSGLFQRKDFRSTLMLTISTVLAKVTLHILAIGRLKDIKK